MSRCETNLPCKHRYSLPHCPVLFSLFILCRFDWLTHVHTHTLSLTHTHTHTRIRFTFVLPCRSLRRLAVSRVPVLSPVSLFRSPLVQTCCLETCPCCFLFSTSCDGFETRFWLAVLSVPKRVIPQSVACVLGRDWRETLSRVPASDSGCRSGGLASVRQLLAINKFTDVRQSSQYAPNRIFTIKFKHIFEPTFHKGNFHAKRTSTVHNRDTLLVYEKVFSVPWRLPTA